MRKNIKRIIAVILVLCTFFSMGIFANAGKDTKVKNSKDALVFLKDKYAEKTKGIKVINAKDGVFVSWKKIEDAKSYVVAKYDPDTKKWSDLPAVNVTYYQDNSVKNGKDYIYRLTYVDKTNKKISAEQGVKIKCLKMPTVKLTCTPNSVMVVWNTFSSATEYRVYRKAGNESKWQCIKVVTNKNTNYIMDYNVKAGQKYTYSLRQVNNGTPGSYNLTGVSTIYKKAPTVTSRHSPQGIVLNWNKVDNNSTYYVDVRSTKNTSWKTVGTVKGNVTYTVAHNKSDYGYENYFRIRVKDTNLVSYSTSVFGIDPNKPMVALTYDDGPLTGVTDRIVKTLKNNGARATFFVVGNRVNTYKDCVKSAYNAGNEIANHSYNHYILTNYDAKTIKSQIDKTNSAVKNITGEAPTLVRAPGGSINSSVKTNVKYPLIQWSVDTLDWKSRNKNAVVSTVKGNVKDGSIILMHDLYGSTADATEVLVPWLKSKGYQMVTVTEMMQIRGYDLKGGAVYYNGYKK